MYLPPLFGPDSIPHFTSRIFSAFGTVIFWLIFFICMVFIKVEPKKPEYKEVQIVLSSEKLDFEKEKQAESQPESSAASAMLQEETPLMEEPAPSEPPQSTVETTQPPTEVKQEAPVKTLETPKEQPKPKPKAEPKKTAPKEQEIVNTNKTQPDKVVPTPIYGKFLDDDIDFEQNSNKKLTDEEKWEKIEGMDFSENTNDPIDQKNNKTVNTKSDFYGSGAKGSDNQKQGQESKVKKDAEEQNSLQGQYSDLLKDIKNVTYTYKVTDTISSNTNISSARSQEGKVLVEMDSGSTRMLIRPSEPVINITPKAAKTLDGDRNVQIKITVEPNGTILRNNIEISNKPLLNDIIVKEIEEQLAGWLFESSNDNEKADATFSLKIKIQ